jgi:hypothetical protein
VIPRKPRPAVELTPRGLRILRAANDLQVSVVVAVSCRTPPGPELAGCLVSVSEQSLNHVGLVLILDGVQAERYAAEVRVPIQLAARTWVLAANCGSPSRARNAALDFIDAELPQVRWVARLDADDRFADRHALAASVSLGDKTRALAVLGGNRVLSHDGHHLRDNPASLELGSREHLRSVVAAMANGTAANELPSCNLMLRTQSGVRYPDMRSAEDHWLVASLLWHHPGRVGILEAPLFADYRLGGPATREAHRAERYHRARKALHAAVETWAQVADLPGNVLGHGQEGIVRLHRGTVLKHYYPTILQAEKVEWLTAALRGSRLAPTPTFSRDGESWLASYPYEPTTALVKPSPAAVQRFLRASLDEEIVCANVKRSNFGVRGDGSLLYIDIGNWIVPMDVSYFRDAATRLYSIGVLGAADEELLRRPADPNRPEIWTELPGLAGFYGDVVSRWIADQWTPSRSGRAAANERDPTVSLLVKVCAMDARDFRNQAVHLVDQLTRPRDFAERVVLIDPHPGPFLRQHASGDLQSVLDEAEELQRQGLFDRVLVSPLDPAIIREVNRRWMGVAATHTHSTDGVPVTPQVWAFEQLTTRYVLQADIDVLVGRKDHGHDYLAEMLTACAPDDVVGVAFNIPHEGGFRNYDAPPGEFKPEVRLGLLDLERLSAQLPLPAGVDDERLTTTWYRALHQAQRSRGLRTVRGGGPQSFYIHPPNALKDDAAELGRIRDLVAQGRVPEEQIRRWDLEGPASSWVYPSRNERVVVVALGRNTPHTKVERFAAGLRIQEDQSFGVVVIDDGSDTTMPSELSRALAWLGKRLTLVRRPERRGRVANYRHAVGTLCSNPDAMILVVDLDDALAHPAAVREVARLSERGHDVVLAAPFRPDVPTRVYSPEFDRVREAFGGDVWIHLRAFRKRLFDQLPGAMLEVDGRPLESLVDYAMMIPMVERARSPIYLPRYRYWHERTTVLDAAGKQARDRLILRLLSKDEAGIDP